MIPRVPPFSSSLAAHLSERWYGEHEVDVVGLTTDQTLIVGECKFRNSPLGYDAFSKLQGHTEELRWTPPDGGDRIGEYALFSRSGFKPSVEEAAGERSDLRLFTVEDVVEALRSASSPP